MPAGYLHDLSTVNDYNVSADDDYDHMPTNNHDDQTDDDYDHMPTVNYYYTPNDNNYLSAVNDNDLSAVDNYNVSADDHDDQEALSSRPADNRAQTGLGFWRQKPRALRAPGTRLYAERPLSTL